MAMETLVQLFIELNARGILTIFALFGILAMFLAILGTIPTRPPVVIQPPQRLMLGCYSSLLLIVGIIGFLFPLVVTTFSLLPTSLEQLAHGATTESPALPTQLMPTQSLPTETYSSAFCQQTVTQGNIPPNNIQQLIVESNEFHLWSSADICVSFEGSEVNCVIGDVNKGYITVFRPANNKTTIYQLSNLVPRNNWHGVYAGCSSDEQIDWINNRAYALSQAPNCADRDGCGEIYIRIFEGNRVDQSQYSP